MPKKTTSRVRQKSRKAPVKKKKVARKKSAPRKVSKVPAGKGTRKRKTVSRPPASKGTKKAAPTYRMEALEEFWRRLSHVKDEDSLFSLSLRLLTDILGKIEAAIFIWDAADYSIKCEKVLHGQALQDGEEVIPLSKDSRLWGLYTGVLDLVVDQKNPANICVALRSEGEFLGMLRIIRFNGKAYSKASMTQIRLFTEEMTYAMNNLRLFVRNEEHMRQLRASFEISSNIVKSLNLGELLELVVKSIVTHLGFDRVRLYLIDEEKQFLNGAIAYDLRGRSIDLQEESYPMKAGSHPLVDHILGKHDTWVKKTFHDVVISVPLQMKSRVIGLLVVDNILSQQRIGLEEIHTIQSFAGQIAMAVENARLFQKVEELSTTDSLTDLYVLRHFKERLETEVYRSKRYGGTLALFMIDVDDFKPINDTYGHSSGDQVLRHIADKIRAILRQTDFACRYGGDEFMLCLVNAEANQALELGRRLLESLKYPVIVRDAGNISVSVSIGVSLFPDQADSIEDVMQQADQALYKVKKKGKHQIHGWWEE